MTYTPAFGRVRDEAAAAGGNGSNPNLYSDPEYELLTVGGTQAWAASAFAVVLDNGAKRLLSPATATATGFLDAAARSVTTWPGSKTASLTVRRALRSPDVPSRAMVRWWRDRCCQRPSPICSTATAQRGMTNLTPNRSNPDA